MYHSLFDVFSIGIGPSSSHTVGPMRAAGRFIETLRKKRLIKKVAQVKTTLSNFNLHVSLPVVFF